MDHLRNELDISRKRRNQIQEYDTIAKKCLALPSRAECQQQLIDVQKEIEQLEQESKSLDRKLKRRKTEFLARIVKGQKSYLHWVDMANKGEVSDEEVSEQEQVHEKNAQNLTTDPDDSRKRMKPNDADDQEEQVIEEVEEEAAAVLEDDSDDSQKITPVEHDADKKARRKQSLEPGEFHEERVNKEDTDSDEEEGEAVDIVAMDDIGSPTPDA